MAPLTHIEVGIFNIGHIFPVGRHDRSTPFLVVGLGPVTFLSPSLIGCPTIAREAIAGDALSLMRSRYSAYVTENEDYLRDTWAEENRPSGAIIEKKSPVKWVGLKIIGHQEHEDRATVEFIAQYKQNGRMQKLHEISRFIRKDAQWYYFDGTYF